VSLGESGEENAGYWNDILCVQFGTGIAHLKLRK